MEGMPSLTIRAWRCILAGVVEIRLNRLEAATLPASFAIASAAREKERNPCILRGFLHDFK